MILSMSSKIKIASRAKIRKFNAVLLKCFFISFLLRNFIFFVVAMIEQALDDNTSEIDEEESFFQDVDLLQKHGINVADIKKLKAAGICTIKGIQMSTKKKLCSIKGFSDNKVEKIKEACQKICTHGFMTALEVSDRRKQVFKISTGSTELE